MPHLGETAAMDCRVSPAGTCPLPGPSWFFLPCLWGMGGVSSQPTFTLPRSPSSPSLPTGGKGGGGALGGQGSPSVLRLHRVFRLNQEIFYYQKEKRKKKSQQPPFLPAPLGQSRLDLWGFPGGWLRAGTLSGKSGGAPWQALRQAHFGLLPSPPSLPSKRTTRGGLPLPSGPRAAGLGSWGLGGVLHSPGEDRAAGGGGQRGPSLPPHCILCPLPRAGHSFHKLLWGRLFPCSKVCAIFSHPSL